MTPKTTAAAGLLAGVTAGHKQAEADRKAPQASPDVCMMPLEAILGRAGGRDTRQPQPKDVTALALSIDALGLLEPLVVDRRGFLLAGKTRLMALRLLALNNPDRWKLVPVRKMDFAAEDEPRLALAVEVAENEQRRDYNAAEIKDLAARLVAEGFKNTPGRPRKGEKALLPALGAVVGKSKRTLLRILETPAPDVETVPDVTFTDLAEKLRRALVTFNRAAAYADAKQLTPQERQTIIQAAALVELIKKTKGDK
jgi:ParB family chromosome partitioning protein